MKKVVLAFLLAATALLLGAAPGRVGAAPGPHPAGMVPHANAFTEGLGLDLFAPAAPRALDNGPLLYNGGPIMQSNAVYAIYWMPSGSTCSATSCAGYENSIDTYFSDVAAASGDASNVYSVATQYCQGVALFASSCNGGGTPIAYSSTFQGHYIDTTNYPSSGCIDGYDPRCLTDAQLQTEIQADIATQHWPTGLSTLFFIFTPDNVGICTDTSAADCSTTPGTGFCAYHNYIPGGGGVVYAVEPDNATIPTPGCDFGEEPTNPAADPTINTISHEQNEAISDPDTTGGWFSAAQSEMGDLCAWDFGTTSGSPGTKYNETIHGDHYLLQQEWSNASPLQGDGTRCVQSYTPSSLPAAPTNSAPPIVSGVAAVGKTLSTSAGSWTGSPTAYTYQWQQCSASGTSCSDISGASSSAYTPSAGDAGHEIRAEVSAANGGGSSSPVPSAASNVVVPVPAASTPPAVSGFAAVGKTLSTTTGSWNTPASYTYQWLRCSGSTCSSIAHATSSTYVPGSADEGHTLEARVAATNAAATTTATSAPTASVVGLPVATKLPHIAGQAKVGKKLSAGKGTWSGPPATYRYQWFRCSAKGKVCVHIAGATKSTYMLGKKDAKHRLRVRVTGFNLAGSHAAFSATTREVPAVKTAKKHH